MPVRPTVTDVRTALRAQLRAEAHAAAGPDRVLDAAEKRTLLPFLRAASLRGRLSTVDATVDRAMYAAARDWAAVNQARGPGKAYLSKAELSALDVVDGDLGALTRFAVQLAAAQRDPPPAADVRFQSAAPGFTMTAQGDTYTLRADQTVPPNTAGVLTVGGAAFEVKRLAQGISLFGFQPPQGWAWQTIATTYGAAPTVQVRIAQDPPGALTEAAARTRARAALVDYVRDVRMQDADWRSYFPTTWADAQARGIEAGIDAFVDPAGETEVLRRVDSYVFVGRGPFDLYTEVEIAKADGALLSAYVEID